jgi:hypothetical protein
MQAQLERYFLVWRQACVKREGVESRVLLKIHSVIAKNW